MKGSKLLLILIVIALFGYVTTNATAWEKGQSFHEKGLAYSRQGNYVVAIEKFKMAVNANPSNADYQYSLGLAYSNNKQFAEAVPHFKKAAELWDSILHQYMLGFAYYSNKQYQEAIDTLQRVIKEKLPEGLASMIRDKLKASYESLGQVESKIRAKKNALNLERAISYAKEGDYKKAMKLCESIDEILLLNSPALKDDMETLLSLVKPIVKPIIQKHKERAIEMERHGRFQEALNELAGAFSLAVDSKEVGEVRNSIFQMVRKMPHPPEISKDARKYALRAEILIKEGDHKGAISEIKKAIRLAPFSAKMYFNAALIYGQLRNYPEAIRYMKIYLQAAPDASNARGAKDEIIKWELLMEREHDK